MLRTKGKSFIQKIAILVNSVDDRHKDLAMSILWDKVVPSHALLIIRCIELVTSESPQITVNCSWLKPNQLADSFYHCSLLPPLKKLADQGFHENPKDTEIVNVTEILYIMSMIWSYVGIYIHNNSVEETQPYASPRHRANYCLIDDVLVHIRKSTYSRPWRASGH